MACQRTPVKLDVDGDDLGAALHIARAHQRDHPASERGVGIRRCVVYTYAGRTWIAYWTKTMQVVRQCHETGPLA